MNEFLENLKHQAEENPLVAMGVAAALITAISKLSNSCIDARRAADWSKEIDRRIHNSTK